MPLTEENGTCGLNPRKKARVSCHKSHCNFGYGDLAYSDLTMLSVIFLASPSNIMVLSR